MAEWWEAAPKASTIDIASDAEGASPAVADLARSVYHQESSGGKNTKTSNAGAVGGMQILPDTFNEVADKGWDINNPEHNARAGVRYLKKLNDLAGGDPKLTAVGYYGGPGAIEKAKKGIAVSDPRNPGAPNTLQYGDQVAGRVQGGGNWWDAAPIEGQNPAAPTDSASAPPAATKNPDAPKDSLVGPPVSAKPAGTWEAIGNAAMHPIDTAKGIGNAIADTASKTIDQAKTDPLGAAKGGLLGVANGLTFGGYKKYLQPALSQAVNGGSFEDAQLRVKDMYDAQGPATTAGELGSVLVPGLGQASLANAAVKAVPTASRLAKVAAGAGAGAVEGAANYVGRSQGPMNLSDASAYMAMGALPGSVMGAANKHTSEQLGNSFIKKAGGDVEAARDAEIVQGLHGLQNRETQGGTALGAKDANALANSYTQKAADAIRKIDPGPERQGLLNALQRGGSMDNEAISALRTSPQGHAVADAIQMQQRTLAMTAAKPANTGTLASAARMAVDNGALGFVPGIGGLLNLKPVRTSVLNMLGGRENRTANISKALKDYEGAVAASKKLGPSAAAKSAQDLQQMGQAAVDAKSALQASQAPFGTRVGRQALDQASSDAEKAATKAAADAEKQKAADIKAAAQRAQDIQKRRDMYTQQRQSDSQAANAERLAAQQQEVRAQQARAQASQGNLENSLQVRQANSADTRSAQTQAMAQQAQAAQAARDRLAGRVAANAENRPVREAPVAPVDPAIAEAAAKARLEARINARVKTNASARAAKAQAAEEAATAQAHAEGAAKAANGEFPDAWDQKSAVQTVLGHVDIDPKDASHIAAVKDTLTKYAAESPENARDVAQFLGKGTKKLEKDKFYGINDRLKAIHGGREPAQAAGSSQGILSESIGPGALSIEDEIRKAKYKGGVANRQNYAKETFQAAPTESVQATVAKMATLKSPEAREALFKAARANATEAEQKFMDRKVEHMIHYRKTE